MHIHTFLSIYCIPGTWATEMKHICLIFRKLCRLMFIDIQVAKVFPLNDVVSVIYGLAL